MCGEGFESIGAPERELDKNIGDTREGNVPNGNKSLIYSWEKRESKIANRRDSEKRREGIKNRGADSRRQNRWEQTGELRAGSVRRTLNICVAAEQGSKNYK